MRNFRELKVWSASMEIVKETYEIASLLPNQEKFGIRSQITRAAVSIPSNIAEGSAKSSNKEVKHYFETSLGSSFEVETQLLVVKDLKLTNAIEEINVLLKNIHHFQRMLNKFITSLKNNRTNTQKPKT